MSLKKHKLPERLMVDCSHANSGKEATKQETAWKSVVEQKKGGSPGILGLMLESHLHEGRQDIPAGGQKDFSMAFRLRMRAWVGSKLRLSCAGLQSKQDWPKRLLGLLSAFEERAKN